MARVSKPANIKSLLSMEQTYRDRDISRRREEVRVKKDDETYLRIARL